MSEAQLSDSAQCKHCGYALRNLPRNVCPECGSEFDPANADSYRDPRRHRDAVRDKTRQFVKLCIGPPGVVSMVLVIIVAAWHVPATTSLAAWCQLASPAENCLLWMAVYLTMAQCLIGAVVHRLLDPAVYPPWPAQSARRWTICIALTVVLLLTVRPWVSLARLRASRAALEAVIATTDASNSPRLCRIGLLDVQYIHHHWPPTETDPRRSCVFVQTESDGEGRYGFLYYPPGSTAGSGWQIAP
ncbi:MAG: hypothetical protein JNG88_16730 [Phycisphaerales bacterium]|nr:hypothetical protein [Phycisphaerales bacterium]